MKLFGEVAKFTEFTNSKNETFVPQPANVSAGVAAGTTYGKIDASTGNFKSIETITTEKKVETKTEQIKKQYQLETQIALEQGQPDPHPNFDNEVKSALNTYMTNNNIPITAIRDTEMASQMVEFTNNNVLAQAGQAMLAQANQANQSVLSLLG